MRGKAGCQTGESLGDIQFLGDVHLDEGAAYEGTELALSTGQPPVAHKTAAVETRVAAPNREPPHEANCRAQQACMPADATPRLPNVVN